MNDTSRFHLFIKCGVGTIESVYCRAVELLEADLGDELVALDPEGGVCFGFNEVATAVWRRLANPATFTELLDYLLEEYDVDAVQCGNDLRELLDGLESKGLISVRRVDAAT